MHEHLQQTICHKCSDLVVNRRFLFRRWPFDFQGGLGTGSWSAIIFFYEKSEAQLFFSRKSEAQLFFSRKSEAQLFFSRKSEAQLFFYEKTWSAIISLERETPEAYNKDQNSEENESIAYTSSDDDGSISLYTESSDDCEE